MAENKSKFWKRRRKIISKDINKLIALTVDTYNNKYYNLWMSKFEWKGLDEDLKEQEENDAYKHEMALKNGIKKN